MPKAKVHGMVLIDGMAHRETSELGREKLRWTPKSASRKSALQ